MRAFIICFLTIALLASCEKESEKVDPAEIIECTATTGKDSVSLSNAVIGSWSLKYYTKPYSAIFIDADKAISVEFRSNKTFIAKENATTLAEGSWVIKPNGTYFDLQTSVVNEYVGGPISICNDKLLFSRSFFDGPDYLFVKAN